MKIYLIGYIIYKKITRAIKYCARNIISEFIVCHHILEPVPVPVFSQKKTFSINFEAYLNYKIIIRTSQISFKNSLYTSDKQNLV